MAKAAKLYNEIQREARKLAKEHSFRASELQDALGFKVSRQYVLEVLRKLTESQELVKTGQTRAAYYSSSTPPTWEQTVKLEVATDYAVRDQLFAELKKLQGLPENVQSIFSYAFTEMMNNAIDHSTSPTAIVKVYIEDGSDSLRFDIRDFGVGVFRNVMKKYSLADEFEAIEKLLEGKTTTAPQAHSGEGIFFTSKIADLFELSSFGFTLRIDNELPDVFVTKTESEIPGTLVSFKIACASSKHLQKLFESYTNLVDLAFDKTHAYIKLYTSGSIYVSRSQAKRILSGVEAKGFREVVLDFNKVPTIGQAFADEVFRVFAHKHPNIKITVVNENEAVSFMIKRAISTASQK